MRSCSVGDRGMAGTMRTGPIGSLTGKEQRFQWWTTGVLLRSPRSRGLWISSAHSINLVLTATGRNDDQQEFCPDFSANRSVGHDAPWLTVGSRCEGRSHRSLAKLRPPPPAGAGSSPARTTGPCPTTVSPRSSPHASPPPAPAPTSGNWPHSEALHHQRPGLISSLSRSRMLLLPGEKQNILR
mgnify:CR=1 FL=1